MEMNQKVTIIDSMKTMKRFTFETAYICVSRRVDASGADRRSLEVRTKLTNSDKLTSRSLAEDILITSSLSPVNSSHLCIFLTG